MGEDVAFNFLGSTPGFTEEFGTERIRNTPITEAGFVGAAAGAAILGMRPIVDMMFAPFLYCAFDQIVSVIAKSTYMYGGQCRMPVTLRATMFYRNGTSAQHSDRPMSTFLTIPGLKILAPACPSDAKGLLKSAIRDDDPVIAFEDNTLWMIPRICQREIIWCRSGKAASSGAGRTLRLWVFLGRLWQQLRPQRHFRRRVSTRRS